jgi:hypothetical protein
MRFLNIALANDSSALHNLAERGVRINSTLQNPRVLAVNTPTKSRQITGRIDEIARQWAADLPVRVPWLEHWAAAALLAWHNRECPPPGFSEGFWGMWWPMVPDSQDHSYQCVTLPFEWELDLEMAALLVLCGWTLASLAASKAVSRNTADISRRIGAILELLDPLAGPILKIKRRITRHPARITPSVFLSTPPPPPSVPLLERS